MKKYSNFALREDALFFNGSLSIEVVVISVAAYACLSPRSATMICFLASLTVRGESSRRQSVVYGEGIHKRRTLATDVSVIFSLSCVRFRCCPLS